MKSRKLLAGIMSAAMVLGTMSIPTFAETTVVASKLPDAVNGKITLTEDVTFSAVTTIKNDIDLNGKTLTLAGKTFNGFYGDITVSNGTIKIADEASFTDSAIGIGAYGDTSNITLKDVTVTAENYESAGGLLGVYDKSTLTLENVVINANDSGAGSDAGIIYGNTQRQNAILKNVTINAEKEAVVVGGIQNADIDTLKFNGKVTNWVFSVVGGNIKNSDFTLTNTDSIKAVYRDYENYYVRTLNMVNTKISGIPSCSATNAFDLQNTDSKIVVDDKSKFTTAENEEITANLTKAEVKIGNDLYVNLADALKVATAEDTITLLTDTKLAYNDSGIENKDFNVALNGKTLTFSTVGCTDTTLRLYSNWNFIGDSDKKSKINFEVDPKVETNESLLAIGYYDNKSFTVKMSDLQLVVPNAKKIYTAFVGVYDGSILDLSNVDVKAEDKTKEIPSIFYGNDVNKNNTIKMRNVKISDIKAEEVLSVFGNVDVEYLTVNAEITGFMLSRVNGTIKNSDFTYSQGKSGSLRAVIRQWSDAHNDAVTLLNTTFNEIPGTFNNKAGDAPEHDTQIALFKDYDVLPNVYMDEKTATYFADEAVAKAKPANGYFKDADGKIKETKVKVNDSVANAGITVILDDLRLNSGVDHSEDATYDVVVSNIKVDDRAAVEGIKNDAANANKTIIAYDISVTKTVGNQTTKATGITNQKVTLTLPTPVKGGETPIVYHINDSGVAEEITTPITVSADGKTITFTAPSFSGYAVAYTPSTTATSVTNEIAVKFESVAGKDNEYNIVLEATDGKVINEFTSADLTFKLTSTEAVSYDVHPSLNMNIIKPAKNRFTIYNDGINRHEHTGTRVPIGKVVFGGYCTGAEFSIDGTALTNVVYATKAGTAIVDEYNPTATTNKLKIDSKISPLTIKEETKNLTINIDFPNTVKDNVKAYQDMKVKISSAKSTEIIDLGTDAKAMVGGKYTITKDLAKGTEYTVEISGAGYRTAYYTLTLTKDTTLNFWNDWKRAGEVEVEVGNANSKTDVTFLAGDIVKDDVINIYDLSAVVSYFNKNLDMTAYSSFACYDLDRNGVIESRDISILLEGLGH